MTEREKLLKVIQQLNIVLPKCKYIKNEQLKAFIVTQLNNQKSPKLTKSKSLPQLNLRNQVKETLTPPQNQKKINIRKCIFPKVPKLVAIGDLHGDLQAAIKALKLANVIDHSISNRTRDLNKINWTGGKTVVVQLGDQIDRVRPSELVNDLCPENDSELNQDEGSDLKIICLFEKLHSQAIKQGGALFSIFGNHELMNVDGDFRYVSPKEFKEFGTFFKEDKTISTKNDVPYGFVTRKNVFAPGGTLAKKLAQTRYSVLQIGSWLFVHGGISPQTANEYPLDVINISIQQWLNGNEEQKYLSIVNKIYHTDNENLSPFWCRIYGENDDSQTESIFNKTLEILNKRNNRNEKNAIKGMIIGHTPQFMYNKGLNSCFSKRLWRTDVGVSRAFGLNNKETPLLESKNRKVQVLVIMNDNDFKIMKEG
jgi:hypothetical protein